MIAFLSNYLNHHQKPLARELYKLTGGQYRFIATDPMPQWRKELGYSPFLTEPYLIDLSAAPERTQEALQIAAEADTLVFGGMPLTTEVVNMLSIRAKNKSLTFEMGERWLKKGLVNLLSPRLIAWRYYYSRIYSKGRFYRLCSSAFAAEDMHKLRAYRDRCFKWGYFTETPDVDIENLIESRNSGKFKIMWCARFIHWKHPETAINLAEKLVADGLDFELNMFGNGPLLKIISAEITKRKLNNVVRIHGSLPNKQIINQMQHHNIFLFTSDRNEGWGAVANEAMAAGCTIVADHRIGSIPYLIKHNHNGIIYKSFSELINAVKKLYYNRTLCNKMALNAYSYIQSTWSPAVAATNFLTLIDNINHGDNTTINEGPCSVASHITVQ